MSGRRPNRFDPKLANSHLLPAPHPQTHRSRRHDRNLRTIRISGLACGEGVERRPDVREYWTSSWSAAASIDLSRRGRDWFSMQGMKCRGLICTHIHELPHSLCFQYKERRASSPTRCVSVCAVHGGIARNNGFTALEIVVTSITRTAHHSSGDIVHRRSDAEVKAVRQNS